MNGWIKKDQQCPKDNVGELSVQQDLTPCWGQGRSGCTIGQMVGAIVTGRGELGRMCSVVRQDHADRCGQVAGTCEVNIPHPWQEYQCGRASVYGRDLKSGCCEVPKSIWWKELVWKGRMKW